MMRRYILSAKKKDDGRRCAWAGSVRGGWLDPSLAHKFNTMEKAQARLKTVPCYSVFDLKVEAVL